MIRKEIIVMYNNNRGYYNNGSTGNGSRRVIREQQEQPKEQKAWIVPTKMLSAPLGPLAHVCVYTETFQLNGQEGVAFNTLDFGFICRVSTEIAPDEDGVIEYDPLHATLNTKGSMPILYIFKSDRINKMRQLAIEFTDQQNDSSIPEYTEEDLPY